MKTHVLSLPSVVAAVLAASAALWTLQPRFARSQTPDAFNPDANHEVYTLAVQTDGKILVGGVFTTLAGQTFYHLGRLDASGTPDSGFNPVANHNVYELAVQPDGKILVGGGFAALAGQTRNCIGRLNANGTLDTGFNPGANNAVYAMALQADGKILLGGPFTALGGLTRDYIGRLNANGTPDPGFDPGANNYVYALAVQADGKILVGGLFTTLGGQPRNHIGRLNADGTLDTGFNPGANDVVLGLAVQPDGKILVGGMFTWLGGQTRNYIGRLNADGTLDSGFNPGANAGVFVLAVQADGKILVGGNLTSLGGQPRNHIGRLNADGTLDAAFTGANNSVYALTLQADGRILVGGVFTTLGGQTRNYIGRLYNTEPATQSLGFDGSTITWLRGGASPEVWWTTFEFSPNGIDWTSLGVGTRITGGWQLSSVSLPASHGTIRARGYVAMAGFGCASSWFAENDLPVVTPAATATAIVVSGFVVDVRITEGGWGYTNTPLVRIIGGGGSGAEAAVVVSNGVVITSSVVNAGSGYTNTPVIVIAPPFIPQPTMNIAALSLLNFTNLAVGTTYRLQSFVGGTLIDLGTNFTAASSTFTQYVSGAASTNNYLLTSTLNATQAQATAVVVNGFVVGAPVTNGGAGYTTNPAVTIVGNGFGSGATASAQVDVACGCVTNVPIATPGAGYINGATIIIAPPPETVLWPNNVTQVMKLDLGSPWFPKSLSPYDNYQLEFTPIPGGSWTNLNAPFTPSLMTDTQYINASGSAGFYRLKYVP